VLFYAQMAADEGHFSIEDVAANLNAKLIRRHPHIFADAVARTPDEVKETWESVKQQERTAKASAPRHLLDEVTRHQPAFLEAAKLGKKASSLGFDWPDTAGLIAKLREETGELEAELQSQPIDLERAEDELGDLLFTAVNLARHLKLEPEFALRAANAKFRRRFNAIEDAAGGAAVLCQCNAEEWDVLWRAAKSSAASEAGCSYRGIQANPGDNGRSPAGMEDEKGSTFSGGRHV
jgi:XTP/dITP diphosphohydrolase/ATP diphosphatase